MPDSSKDLFKTYFVDDLAPRFIADKTGSKYVLRLTTKNNNTHKLVDINQLGHVSLDLARLFKEGHLSHEVIDIRNKRKVSGFLREFSDDILKLKSTTELLQTLIRTHCKLGDIF